MFLSNQIEMKKGMGSRSASLPLPPSSGTSQSLCFGIEGLTVIQQRVIAIFVFATLSWLFEAIPSWATSLVIISETRLTLSDNSIACFEGEGEAFGELLKSKGIMATFANPVIMLFLGGFILAIAATKSGL